MSDTYAQAGVDLDAGNEFSKYCFELAKETFHNCPYLDIEMGTAENYFRGDLSWLPRNLPTGCRFDDAADGIGTKTLLPGIHESAGHDLVAMTCGDAVRKGGVPLKITNILDVRTLGKVGSTTYMLYQAVMRSLQEAANLEGIAMYRGETAELGPCVGSENYDADAPFNWGASVTVAKDPLRAITGDSVEPGNWVVAIKDSLRSNGLSVVRRALKVQFGNAWWNNPDAALFIKLAAEPSVLWARFIAAMNGWYAPNFEPLVKMNAIAHITGGGIPEKFGKDLLFRRGLSAELTDLWVPTEIMRLTRDWLNKAGQGIDDREFFKIFNGGQGALVVVPSKSHASLFVEIARDWGLQTKSCGEIIQSHGEPRLLIKSKITGKVAEYGPNDI